MRPRHLIAAVACCSVLSTGIGFAAAQLSHPDPASARAGSSAVVSQLKKLHRDLATVHTDLNGISTDMGTVATQVTELDTHVGSSAYDSGSVFNELHDIEHNTDEACQALEDSTVC